MADADKDEILSILKKSTAHKEETDLKKDIREVKTDRKDDIKEIRNTLRTMTNLIITFGERRLMLKTWQNDTVGIHGLR